MLVCSLEECCRSRTNNKRKKSKCTVRYRVSLSNKQCTSQGLDHIWSTNKELQDIVSKTWHNVFSANSKITFKIAEFRMFLIHDIFTAIRWNLTHFKLSCRIRKMCHFFSIFFSSSFSCHALFNLLRLIVNLRLFSAIPDQASNKAIYVMLMFLLVIEKKLGDMTQDLGQHDFGRDAFRATWP